MVRTRVFWLAFLSLALMGFFLFQRAKVEKESNLSFLSRESKKRSLLIFAANEPSEASPERSEGAPELPMGFFTEFTLSETNVFRMTTKKCHPELTRKYTIWPVFLLKLLQKLYNDKI